MTMNDKDWDWWTKERVGSERNNEDENGNKWDGDGKSSRTETRIRQKIDWGGYTNDEWEQKRKRNEDENEMI